MAKAKKPRPAPPEAALSKSIIASIRDPLMVLDTDLRVLMANEAYCRTFRVQAQDVERRVFTELGRGQWNDPKLIALLRDIAPRHSFFDDFEVTHEFEIIGRRTMLLSAREMKAPDAPPMIVLSIQDITERLQYQAHVLASELRFRRLFEAAKDGILMLDPISRTITEANSAAMEMLGFPSREVVGRELWQLGLFETELASHRFFRELQEKGSVRLADVSITSPPATIRLLELMSTLYEEGGRKLIQCNIRDITQQKQAEAILRARTAELESIINQTPFILNRCSRALRYVFVSRAYAEMLGRPPETIVGQPIADIMGEEGFKTVSPYIDRVLKGERVEYEATVRFKGAGSRALHVNYVPDMDEGGNVKGWIASIVDLTAHKEAANALQQSEQRLAYALDAAIGGIWDWNIQTGQVFYSRLWIESMGYRPDDVPPHVSFWESLVHPEDRPRVSDALQAHFEGRTPVYQCHNRLRRKDGTYRWNLDRGKVVEWDAKGKPLRMVGADMDVTEQRRKEDDLRQTFELNQAIMRCMGEGLYTLNAQGLVTYLNPAAEELLGWSQADLLGRRMHDAIHYKRRDGTPFPIEDCAGLVVLKEGRALIGHPDLFIRKDGSFLEVIYSSSPIRTGETIAGLVVVFRQAPPRSHSAKR